MIGIATHLLPIWKTIEHKFISDLLEPTKLNRQLEIFNIWRNLRGYGCVEAVTGFGKTMIAIIAIMRLNLHNRTMKTIVVVPNTSLKEDWTDPIQGYITRFQLLNVEVHVVNGYTLYNRQWVCDLLVLDEVHRYAREEADYFSTVLSRTTNKYCLALSATLNSKEKIFLLENNVPIVATVGLDEAEKRGWISNFHIYNIPVHLREYDEMEKQRLDEMHNNYYKKFNHDYEIATGCAVGNNKSLKHKKLGYKTGSQWRTYWATKMGWNTSLGDAHKWSPLNVGKYANMWRYAMRSRKDFLHKAVDKIDMVEQIINRIRKKTIVFSEHIDTCEKLKERLGNYAEMYHSGLLARVYEDSSLETEIANGIKINNKTYYKKLNGDIVSYDDLKLEYPNCKKLGATKLKKRIKEDFENNKFQVLLTAQALNEGFDCKDVEVGIIHSGNSVKRTNVQRMGRVLRVHEDKSALIINVYVDDSQDKKWVEARQIGTPKSKIHWITSVNEINVIEEQYNNEDLVLLDD